MDEKAISREACSPFFPPGIDLSSKESFCSKLFDTFFWRNDSSVSPLLWLEVALISSLGGLVQDQLTSSTQLFSIHLTSNYHQPRPCKQNWYSCHPLQNFFRKTTRNKSRKRLKLGHPEFQVQQLQQWHVMCTTPWTKPNQVYWSTGEVSWIPAKDVQCPVAKTLPLVPGPWRRFGGWDGGSRRRFGVLVEISKATRKRRIWRHKVQD